MCSATVAWSGSTSCGGRNRRPIGNGKSRGHHSGSLLSVQHLDQVPFRVAHEQDPRAARRRPRLAQRLDPVVELGIKGVDVVDREPEVDRARAIELGLVEGGARRFVLDQFESDTVGVEVGERARCVRDVDGVGERFAGDGELREELETERVGVKVDRTAEVGDGDAYVVCAGVGHGWRFGRPLIRCIDRDRNVQPPAGRRVRMHVVVNAAQSVDGKLATRRREQLRISGSEDFDRVDRVSAAADAVLVGVGTVLADDPHLTLDEEDRRVNRLTAGRSGNPARVVLDSTGRTPTDARILDDAATTYLLVSAATTAERRAALEAAGAEVVVAGADGVDSETDGVDSETSRVDLEVGFAALAERGVDRLMVEGGGEVVFSCFEAGLVDELHVYVGSLVIGGRDAPTLADGDGFVDEFPRLELTGTERLDEGIVLSYEVRDDSRL